MLCDLCTMDVIRGDMYASKNPHNDQQPWHVCSACRSLVIDGKLMHVDEVDEHNAWLASMTKTGT